MSEINVGRLNFGPGSLHVNEEATNFSSLHVGPSVADLEREMALTINRFNEDLRGLFPGNNYLIDEIAVMFPDRESRMAWLMDAVKNEGVSIFNAAIDSVSTNPIRSSYVADYVFLRKPTLPWRIEAMVIGDGVSPLHAPMAGWSPRPIHASFKVHSRREWGQVYNDLAEDDDYWLAQSCVSDYGRFAYFRPCGEDSSGLYLKPRLNERDSA